MTEYRQLGAMSVPVGDAFDPWYRSLTKAERRQYKDLIDEQRALLPPRRFSFKAMYNDTGLARDFFAVLGAATISTQLGLVYCWFFFTQTGQLHRVGMWGPLLLAGSGCLLQAMRLYVREWKRYRVHPSNALRYYALAGTLAFVAGIIVPWQLPA